MKAWNKKKISLVSVGMLNHSFLIFFARLTMFIVKFGRQLIRKINRLDFSFWKQNSVESQRHKYAYAQYMSHTKRTCLVTTGRSALQPSHDLADLRPSGFSNYIVF